MTAQIEIIVIVIGLRLCSPRGSLSSTIATVAVQHALGTVRAPIVAIRLAFGGTLELATRQ